MSDDIVARLREFGADLTKEIRDGDHGEDGHLWVLPYQCIEQAADEIERLRQLSGEAGQLRKERDEARREVCVWSCRFVRADRFMPTKQSASETEEDVAKRRGWDCFEEAKP